MQKLATFTALASIVAIASAAVSLTVTEHNPADTISLELDHASSFRHFSPELPQMRARAATINTEFGLHVSEIEPGLFFVTDLVYQSAFVVTDDGIVVLDAPPSFGPNLREVIAMIDPPPLNWSGPIVRNRRIRDGNQTTQA